MDNTQMPEGAIPVDQFQTVEQSAAQPHAPSLDSQMPEGAIPVDQFESQTSKFEAPMEQLKTFGEGVGEGVAGPLFTLAQKAANVNPEEILARREINPGVHALGQATGLGASLMTGMGEGALLGKAGQVASELATGAKAAEELGLAAKIGGRALDEATQMALMQGSDEVSKMIINDPNTTAQSAIADVGLAAALGGTLGAGIGAISPLWKAGKEAIGLDKHVGEFANEVKTLVTHGEPVAKASQELTGTLEGMNTLRKEMGSAGGVKAELITEHLPKPTESNTTAVKGQLEDLYGKIKTLKDDYAHNPTVGNFPSLLQQWEDDLTHQVLQAKDDFKPVYKAVDTFKKELSDYAKKAGAYDATYEASKAGILAKDLASEVRPMLENEAVWGKAGTVQKEFNSIQHEFLGNAQTKDFLKKFSEKVGDEYVISPNKINTFFNQVGTSKAEIKTDVLKQFVDSYDKYATEMNKMAAKHGIEPLVEHPDLNMVRHFMEEPTKAQLLARKFVQSLGDKTAAKAAGAALGGGMGGMLGHPGLGAIAGEHALSPLLAPVFNGLTKSIVENAANGGGLKSAIDYSMKAAKAAQTVSKATANVLKPGAQVLAVSAIPSAFDRKKLDKVVTDLNDNPNKMLNINNGKLSHYMADHQAAMTQTTTRAAQYLAQVKPKPFRSSPLDMEIKPTEAQMQRYNRALDVAQNPLVVLHHAKEGTLQISDVQDLAHMYPDLYNNMRQKISNELLTQVHKGTTIPYKTRVGVSLFLGQPLDSSMNPLTMQANQSVFATTKPGAQQQEAGQKAKVSQKGMSALSKEASMYMTPGQNRAAKQLKD